MDIGIGTGNDNNALGDPVDLGALDLTVKDFLKDIGPNYHCVRHGARWGDLVISDGTHETAFCGLCLRDFLLRLGLVPMSKT